MARGKVNQDHDNPLRLLAVANDHVHYFTGKPCPRGHIVNRFAKSGRCIECCHEDRRNFSRTEKGKAVQQRRDLARHIRKTGKAPTPRKEWYERLELYNRLVEAGLPITPNASLNSRVQVTWAAYHELTSDDTQNAYIEREQRRERREQNAAARTAQQERTIARKANATRRRALVALKRSMRVNRVKQAQEVGLPINTVRARVYQGGWSWERALSTPITAPFCNKGHAARARAAGIPIGTAEQRVSRGWTWDQALSIPSGGTFKGIAKEARERGIPKKTVYNRMTKGWTREMAMATPHVSQAERAERHAKRVAERAARVAEREQARAEIEAIHAARLARRAERQVHAANIEQARAEGRARRAAKRQAWMEALAQGHARADNIEQAQAEGRARRAAKKQARMEALRQGHTTFESPIACKKCGGSTYYATAGCKHCIGMRYVPRRAQEPCLTPR